MSLSFIILGELILLSLALASCGWSLQLWLLCFILVRGLVGVHCPVGEVPRRDLVVDSWDDWLCAQCGLIDCER